MVEWPLAVLPSRSLWSFLAIGYTVCLPLSLSFKTLSYATPEWLLIKCLLILSKEVCLAYFSKLMSVNNVCRLACIPQIAFYVMKHYGNSPGSLGYSAHIAGIFFFLCIALGCMVSLLHSNRKPVVCCRSKLDTALEFAPMVSWGHAVYMWQLVRWWRHPTCSGCFSQEVGRYP